MIKIHSLGFPRIGRKRELKFALENYWSGKSDVSQLKEVAKNIRQFNLNVQKNLDFIPVGDFTFYDHVLNTSLILGVIPERFIANEDKLTTFFRMARGRSPNGKDVKACEMTKWFNTNYHYLVPELKENQEFNLDLSDFLEQIQEAQNFGFNINKLKPILVGPVTFLKLAKQRNNENEDEKLKHLPKLLKTYEAWLKTLEEQKIEWVQIDEPILVTDLSLSWQNAIKETYNYLKKNTQIKILLATYFETLGDNQNLVFDLPVDGLHVDVVAGKEQLEEVNKNWNLNKVLSLGIINGRNIWKTNLREKLEILEPIAKTRAENLWLSSSCSLLHSPVDLDLEEKLDSEIKSWLAFAIQKIQELETLAKGLNQGLPTISKELEISDLAIESRKNSKRVHNEIVSKNLNEITESDFNRPTSFKERIKKQQKILNLPIFPTTTIGSFPQTSTIRNIRKDWRTGNISDENYTKAIQEEIKLVVAEQEKLGLDMLVHGEPERNDMVEYFGELLDGFAFSSFGWVQSYGSRCVKPPIIFGDVYRSNPMTLDWTSYAQSLTNKPVKGMLTGPITILGWSFEREDISLEKICQQIALALNDEVLDLEKAKITAIQIDEPAFRELLPLKKSKQADYLKWSVDAFKLSYRRVKDETQIHTHMCYSEFNEIISPIAKLDADVITIETSRSSNELLEVFKDFNYPNDIGPGIYDIHSPRVPDVEEMTNLIERAINYIPTERIWVNPDCGLKTRGWTEVRSALENMIKATLILRDKYKTI